MKVGRLSLAGEVLVPQLLMAESMFARMRGLLGRSGLPAGTAMLLRPCSSIHMVGMQFSLDVIFLDRKLKVTRVVRALRPLRFACGGRGAYSAIEMESGAFDLESVSVGSQLEVFF